MSKDGKKALLSTMLTLAIPTIIEEILATLLQYVDTAMVGHLGEQATASVSITTTITWLVNSIAGAVGIASLALISKAVGGGEKEKIQDYSRQVIWLAVVCGLITGGISILLSPYIPIWMGAEEAIWDQASLYFTIVSLPMVFRAFTSILGASIRATQDTRTPMLINMTANCINGVLNYVLIYGLNLGVTGAAMASALAYTFSGLMMFRAYRRNKTLYWPWSSFQVKLPLIKDFAKIGIPVLGTSLTSCLGYVVFAGLVSDMGTTIFAAHSIAVTAETIFYIPGYGLRTAISAMGGSALGEKNQKKIEEVGFLSVALTMGMMCVSGIFLYLISYPLMRLFTSSAQVAGLGAEMLKLVAFSEPFFGLMIVMEGIFYGLGRTRYAFAVETCSMWGIRIFFTFLCVKIWGLDLRAVWYCMIGDNVFKAVFLALPAMTRKGRKRIFS